MATSGIGFQCCMYRPVRCCRSRSNMAYCAARSAALLRRILLIELTLGTLSRSQTASSTSLSRISQAKIVGFCCLYWTILLTTAGVATLGLLPPIDPVEQSLSRKSGQEFYWLCHEIPWVYWKFRTREHHNLQVEWFCDVYSLAVVDHCWYFLQALLIPNFHDKLQKIILTCIRKNSCNVISSQMSYNNNAKFKHVYRLKMFVVLFQKVSC